MSKLLLTACCAVLSLAAAEPAPIEQNSASVAQRSAAGDINAKIAEAALLTLGEDYRRMTIPVSINGQGPYPFVIDTGAERTVISRQLAELLALRAGPQVTVAAMSGPSRVGTFVIPHLSVEQLAASNDIAAPGLDKFDLGAHGLLGLDMLDGHLIRFDFRNHRMAVRDSPPRRLPRRSMRKGEIVVTARREHHQLVITDAEFRGRKIRVMIDTGSTVSIGNPAFQALAANRHGLSDPFLVRSVTGTDVVTRVSMIDGLKLGTMIYRDLPIAFSGDPPFHSFSFRDEPVLILGMDALSVFSEVEIDFTNARIKFMMPTRSYVPRPWW